MGPRAGRPRVRLGLGAASLVLAGFLLGGFRAPDDGTLLGTTSAGSDSGTTGGGTTGGGTTGGATGTTTGGSRPAATSGTGSATYDGSVIDTRYGPVEVEITVSNGKVVAATAIELPSGGRSGMISSYVEPVLSSEALQAQSASIDIVSGATYTSEAYAQSLQAALDRAGI
jgi:uncharacterized protein with FMN-binding domain